LEDIVKSRLDFLSNAEVEAVRQNELLELLEIKKSSEILREGKICDSIYLIVKGSVRQYGIKKGEEVNFLFYFDGDFVFDELSFYEKMPTKYYFKTLERTTLLKLNKAFFDRVNQDDRIHNFLFKLSRQNVARLYKRNEVLLMDTAEERYLKLLELHPKIIEKVSLAKIASFIGVAPPSLSRIRKRLARK